MTLPIPTPGFRRPRLRGRLPVELLRDVEKPSRRARKQLPRPEPGEAVTRVLDEFATSPELLEGVVQP